MNRIEQLQLMAAYNAWMNTKVYEAASRLTPVELRCERGAFFGSILGTLNHLVVGDTIWLKRFAGHPAGFAALEPLAAWSTPTALDQILFDDLPQLASRRTELDSIISAWMGSLNDLDLDHDLRYANMKEVACVRNFFALLAHFFNHQTHHRGQVTTLLSQAGVDVGVTDLLALIPQRANEGS
jgi:uncharacterized damage-inducible protein DinB